jgi:hypothetical protein
MLIFSSADFIVTLFLFNVMYRARLKLDSLNAAFDGHIPLLMYSYASLLYLNTRRLKIYNRPVHVFPSLWNLESQF